MIFSPGNFRLQKKNEKQLTRRTRDNWVSRARVVPEKHVTDYAAVIRLLLDSNKLNVFGKWTCRGEGISWWKIRWRRDKRASRLDNATRRIGEEHRNVWCVKRRQRDSSAEFYDITRIQRARKQQRHCAASTRNTTLVFSHLLLTLFLPPLALCNITRSRERAYALIHIYIYIYRYAKILSSFFFHSEIKICHSRGGWPWKFATSG